MHFETQVISEDVWNDVDTCTLLAWCEDLTECHCGSDINSVPTEIGHVLVECIWMKYYMWLIALSPIGRIDSNGSSKHSYVLSECVAFNQNQIHISRNIYQAQSFISVEYEVSLPILFSSKHGHCLATTKEVSILLTIANCKIKFTVIGINKSA